jgi:hypothetical protein
MGWLALYTPKIAIHSCSVQCFTSTGVSLDSLGKKEMYYGDFRNILARWRDSLQRFWRSCREVEFNELALVSWASAQQHAPSTPIVRAPRFLEGFLSPRRRLPLQSALASVCRDRRRLPAVRDIRVGDHHRRLSGRLHQELEQ